MKLKRIFIKNFRCYKNEVVVNFDNMTTLIGKNDIGKSTVMDALEIFFNNSTVKIIPDDLNVEAEDKKVTIACEFIDLPGEIVIDADAKTTLKDEYLTTIDDTLMIKKVYDCGKKIPSAEVFICANHPTAEVFSSILSMKQKELQKIVNEKELEANRSINTEMRRAIWGSVPEDQLKLSMVDIDVSKTKEDANDIWKNLERYIPAFALFQSDRNSTDADNEVQNPMKYAVQMAISEVQDEIAAINARVQQRAMEIANNTHRVLQTLDRNLAASLVPKFDSPTPAKWNGLFNISMNTDNEIPLNKRGSGVRRLILLSFFKAEADRKAQNSTKRDVIYAIEEPETSLHPTYQELMIQSFCELSQSGNCQVILTTHSPNLAKELPIDSIRFITRRENGVPVIEQGNGILPSIVEALGVLPDVERFRRVQVILCLEGPTDVPAFLCFNRCLHEKYKELVDIESDERVVIMPLGGSALKYWVSHNYLQKLGCKEVHIYDNDVTTYQEAVDVVNARGDGSWGVLTQKYEIENYLHPDAIKSVYDVDVDTTQNDVPKLFAIAYSNKKGLDGIMKGNTAKTYLSKVFNEAMTMEEITKIGAEEEILGWFQRIHKMLQ